jgi:hypothetical protein
MKYLQNIMEYWFVFRENLKQRSNLHKHILLEEEREHEIKTIKAYFTKFNPSKLKAEGL